MLTFLIIRELKQPWRRRQRKRRLSREFQGSKKTWLNRVRTESWILEKVLKFAQQFSRPGKIEVKSWKKCKASWVFLKATTSASQMKFFSCWSNLIQSRLHVMEKALFRLFFKVSVNHLFDNLESRKINYYFRKSLGPVVRRPISANPGLNFNLGFFVFCSKAFSRIIFSLLFKHPIIKL